MKPDERKELLRDKGEAETAKANSIEDACKEWSRGQRGSETE